MIDSTSLKGKVPFAYPFKRSLKDFKEHNYNVILKEKSVRYININCDVVMDDDISN